MTASSMDRAHAMPPINGNGTQWNASLHGGTRSVGSGGAHAMRPYMNNLIVDVSLFLNPCK
jgi:hypothetical protein